MFHYTKIKPFQYKFFEIVCASKVVHLLLKEFDTHYYVRFKKKKKLYMYVCILYIGPLYQYFSQKNSRNKRMKKINLLILKLKLNHYYTYGVVCDWN